MDLCTPRDYDGPAASLMRSTDHARRALRLAGFALGVLAVVVAVPVGLAASLTPTDDPQAAGVTAGLATLMLCWVLLGLGAAWWDRRLTALDLRRWAADWASVEPRWSNRG